MSGEEKRRPAHCGKRAKDKAAREIGAEEDNQQFLLGACEEDSDRARDQFHEKLNKPHDEGREEKNQGRFLKVSQPKRSAELTENPIGGRIARKPS